MKHRYESVMICVHLWLVIQLTEGNEGNEGFQLPADCLCLLRFLLFLIPKPTQDSSENLTLYLRLNFPYRWPIGKSALHKSQAIK